MGFFALICLVVLTVQKSRDDQRDAERAQETKREVEFFMNTPRLRAKILSAEQSGLVNLKPNFRLVLRIEGPDGVYPVETEQYVEFADVQRIVAGRTVDVKFDPKVRDRIRLCSNDIVSADVPFDDRGEAAFLRAAQHVSAEVLSVSEIPTVSIMMPGLPPNLWLSLRVDAPGGAYEAQTCIPSVGVRKLEAGDKIGVWVEPNNRDRLELDFSDIAAADLPTRA